MTDVTRILNAIEQGDAQATEKLLPLVYEELPGRPLKYPVHHVGQPHDAGYRRIWEPPGKTQSDAEHRLARKGRHATW